MSRGFHMGGAGGSGLDPFVAYTRSFDASGVVESFTVPAKGIYELEVWGCTGAGGGNGGYSKGYALLEKGEIIYVACGNANGFNGGGNAGSASTGYTKYAGGGATHFAKVTGQISAIGKTEFVDNRKGLIVAGGGGGAASGGNGGYGGGLEGGRGAANGTFYGTAANQSAGGTAGYGAGSFGQGGYNNNGSGGGGGLYGGGAGGYSISAGGGSGYIDGVPAITYDGVTYSPSTQQNIWGSLGKAKITRVA